MASKRKRTTPVWTYMEQTSSDVIVCLVCKDKLQYSVGTSNTMKHLRTRHPTECAEFKEDADWWKLLPNTPDHPPVLSQHWWRPSLGLTPTGMTRIKRKNLTLWLSRWQWKTHNHYLLWRQGVQGISKRIRPQITTCQAAERKDSLTFYLQ